MISLIHNNTTVNCEYEITFCQGNDLFTLVIFSSGSEKICSFSKGAHPIQASDFSIQQQF